jgi:phosphopantothenoylcysteine decarboxylase / phosphopantothenate---cysteine ligase
VVRRRRPGQLVIGFAAETENRIENGRAKLLRKGADAIVINDVSGHEVGIDSDRNAATFLTPTTSIEMPEMSKRKLADRILDEALVLRRPKALVVEGQATSPQDQVLHQSLKSGRRTVIVE